MHWEVPFRTRLRQSRSASNSRSDCNKCRQPIGREDNRPKAYFVFGVTKAWRFWSLTDPSLHQATYEFADEASLDRAMKGDDLKRLVADFNRD